MANPATEAIERDLGALGVEHGDFLLVMADVRYLRLPKDSLGQRPKDFASELLAGLLMTVGKRGTVMSMTFSPVDWFPRRRANRRRFNRSDRPTTGGLAAAMVQHPESVRSTHPSNSFTAIGPIADEVLRFHTPYSYTQRPVEDLVNRGGKMLTIGCVDTTPGFSTVHLAQYHLGLSQRSLVAGLPRSEFIDPSGRPSVFRKKDIPGCSMGFGKMYPVYRRAGYLRESAVCRARSVLISAPEAYKLDYAVLAQDPIALNCDSPDCIDCQVLKHYQPGLTLKDALVVAKEGYRRVVPARMWPSRMVSDDAGRLGGTRR